MQQKAITGDQKSKLREAVDDKIDEVTKEVDALRKIFYKLEKANSFSTQFSLQLKVEGLKNLLEYRLFIGILILDLSVALKIYLNARFQYEGIFSARQTIVIINEGYKKIYNFIKEKEDGNKITRHRNNSFWIKEIGGIIKKDLPKLQNEYDLLTSKLENFLTIDFAEIKVQRDLSIHYDKSPTAVYDMLANLDIETTFQKLIPFQNILNEMFAFTNAINQGYKEKIENEAFAQDRKIEHFVSELDKYKNDGTETAILELQDKISELKNLF